MGLLCLLEIKYTSYVQLLLIKSIMCVYSMNTIKVLCNLPEGVVEGSVDIGECWIVEEFTGLFHVERDKVNHTTHLQ